MSVKRPSTSGHWSTARSASSAVTIAPPSTSGRPHTSVIAARRFCSPRHTPTTSSQRSMLQSGLASAVSAVKSAVAWKSPASSAPVAGAKLT